MNTKFAPRFRLLVVLVGLLCIQLACSLSPRSSKPGTAVPQATEAAPEAAQPSALPTQTSRVATPASLPEATTEKPAPTQAGKSLSGASTEMDTITSAVRTTLSTYPRIAMGTVQDSVQGTDILVRIENAAPGMGHTNVTQDGVTLMEVILITPTLYVKQAGSDWQTLPAEQAGVYASIFVENIDPQTYMQGIDAQVQFSLTPAGQEMLNGTNMNVYLIEGKFTDGTVSTGKIWIGIQDQRIYQSTIQTSDGKTVLEQYDFNTPVTVEAPVTGQSPQEGTPKGTDLASMGMCQAVPGDFVGSVLGRTLVSDPQPFEDSYLGKGCQYDAGSDSSAVYFAYVSLAPIGSFEDTYKTGYLVKDVAGLGMQAFTANGADAEQLWVKISEDTALVVAIGDVPNPDGARQIAVYYLALTGN